MYSWSSFQFAEPARRWLDTAVTGMLSARLKTIPIRTNIPTNYALIVWRTQLEFNQCKPGLQSGAITLCHTSIVLDAGTGFEPVTTRL